MARYKVHKDTILNWLSDAQIMWLVTDETHEVVAEIEAAAEELRKKKKEKVEVWCHDKVVGFYQNMPGIKSPEDGSTSLSYALKLALASQAMLADMNSDAKFPPGWDPTRDYILVLKDVEFAISQDPSASQLIVNAVHHNMCSPEYADVMTPDDVRDRNDEEEMEQHRRGNRLLVIVTSSDSLPIRLPVLQPQVVPLPDRDVLRIVVDKVLDALIEDKQHPAVSEEIRNTLATAGLGFTFRKWEETLSISLVDLKAINEESLPLFLEAIDDLKGRYIAGVPGLTYVSKSSLPDEMMPGFEDVIAFILERLGINPSKADHHRLSRLRAMALGGGPGVGKSRFAMMVARVVGKMLILWDLGSTQGGIVGETEKNFRRAIQIIEALAAVALLDDIDKAGVGNAANGQTGNDSFTRGINQLLTHVATDNLLGTYILTFNRTANLPPELLRDGRMDGRFYIMDPDEITRRQILEYHIKRHRVTVAPEQEAMLGLLASDELTKDWVGAELAALVLRGTYRAVSNGTDVLDMNYLCSAAKGTTPMARNQVFKADLDKIKQDCADFTHVGRVSKNPVVAATVGIPGASRAGRRTKL